jgi:DNA-binding IclR family transcriptional regulator
MKSKARPLKAPPKANPKDQTSGAESSRRVLRLLMSFSAERPTASVEQLAADVGVPLSTAYRYVTLLREVGLLEASEAGIQVSPRVIQLGRAAVAANGIIEIARPVLQEMRDLTGESTLLIRRFRDSALCVDRVECGQPVRLSFEPGQPLPLHGGASAKVLLAFMRDPERRRYLQRLPKLLPDKARRKALLEELPLIRERGWALSEAEVDPGVWAAAAAVSNGRDVIAAVSVAVPAYRLPKAQRPRILDVVRKGAAKLSAQLTPLHE